jgi:hypothetical protein
VDVVAEEQMLFVRLIPIEIVIHPRARV